jgi:hypothetical protein
LRCTERIDFINAYERTRIDSVGQAVQRCNDVGRRRRNQRLPADWTRLLVVE